MNATAPRREARLPCLKLTKRSRLRVQSQAFLAKEGSRYGRWRSVRAGSNEERLRLENRNFTRRRIAHVADRTRAAQAIELRLRERFRDVSHLAFLAKFDTVGSDNATRLLAAMLQRIQTQVSQACSVRMTVNSEDAHSSRSLLISISVN